MDPARETETLAEVEVGIDNWRWKGVPFILRSGKALGAARKEAIVTFRPVPHLPSGFEGVDSPNQLRIGFGPDTLQIDVDVNGPGNIFTLDRVTLNAELNASDLLPYGEVLEGVITGDPLLSVRGDTAVDCWRIIEPVLKAWAKDSVPLEKYDAGGPGPADWPTRRRGLTRRPRSCAPALLCKGTRKRGRVPFQVPGPSLRWALDGCCAPLARADTDCFVDVYGPDLAVTGTAGIGGSNQDIEDVVCLLIRGQDLHADLGKQIHVVLGPAVHLGVTTLPAVAAGRADRQSLYPVCFEPLADGVELLRADDRRNEFHAWTLSLPDTDASSAASDDTLPVMRS
ncbi:glucose-6-phosphate 1-dehydrogenase [Arthrobacter sp. Hiyo1]|nr:glucose-6-phosphate 1-dehydrogenase [Arthrobacter sp. Hiyo1]